MRFIWFVWRSSLTRSFDATRATLQELNPEPIFDFHRKPPQNHTPHHVRRGRESARGRQGGGEDLRGAEGDQEGS